MSMSMVISWVLPISSLPLENTVGYLSHNSSKADLVVGLTSASCRSTFLGPGISAGDVRNALSMGTAGSLYFAWFYGKRGSLVLTSSPLFHHNPQAHVLLLHLLWIQQNLQFYPYPDTENAYLNL